MSISEAVVVAGVARRRPSPFALGLDETAAAGIESSAVMPKAAVQPVPRARMNAEQLEARQQQREIGRASCRERVYCVV